MTFQIPSASVEAYKCSFFPQTNRDLNYLPDSLISSSEMSDGCVSIRSSHLFFELGTSFPQVTAPGEKLSNGSESDLNSL